MHTVDHKPLLVVYGPAAVRDSQHTAVLVYSSAGQAVYTC